MSKKEAIARFRINTTFKFTDEEDLAQQVADLTVELESLGFEIEASVAKIADEDEEEETEDDSEMDDNRYFDE